MRLLRILLHFAKEVGRDRYVRGAELSSSRMVAPQSIGGRDHVFRSKVYGKDSGLRA